MNIKSVFSRVIAIVIITLFSSSLIQAATITVTTTNHIFATDGECSLEEAISAANTNTASFDCPAGDDDSDTIEFAAGVSGTITAPGGFFIDSDLIINGPGFNNLTIDANGSGSIFTVNGSGSQRIVNISGLTITGGNTVRGGGIALLNDDTIFISSCVISGNTASNGGGGIYSNGNLSITNSTVSNNSADRFGGGIFIESGSLTITGSTVLNNFSIESGGGIYNNGIATISNSSIDNNTIGNLSAGGGGIFNAPLGSMEINANSSVSDNTTLSGNGGGIFNHGILTINENSLISSNSSAQYGGGITNEFEGVMTITSSTIRNNSANDGGGVYQSSSSATTSTITTSTIEGNSATNNGGGLFNIRELTISGSDISNNTADSRGGGIYIAGSGILNVDNTGISNNSTSGDGGGILNLNGTVTLTNTIVNSNTAELNGGAIYNEMFLSLSGTTVENNTATTGRGGAIHNTGFIRILDSTINNNQNSQGVGGIVQSNVAYLANTTISNNIGAGVQNTFATGVRSFFSNVTIYSNTDAGYLHGQTASFQNTLIANNGVDCSGTGVGFNDIGWNLDSDNTCTFNQPSDLPGTDPMLGPLADNGGQTYTHALLAGSPAIDAGNPAGCSWDDDNDPLTQEVTLTQDQRGITRPQDGDMDGTSVCDIGAYEVILPQEIDVLDSIVPNDDLQITFGDVDTGNTNDQIVTLSNLGGTDLQVTDLQLSGTDAMDFSFDLMAGGNPCGGLTIVVSGGGSCTVGVSFVPQNEGAKSASLSVTSDDADEGTVTVTLSGTGTVPSGGGAPAGGGGGGCTIASNSPFDPLLPLMVGLALIYLARSRCKQGSILNKYKKVVNKG